MANYIPKAEQFDTLNSKLDAINENLKTRASFVEAVAKMENATEAAEEAATAANTAAAGVVSPTATVTKTGDTATITITDKAGTTSAEVKDGSNASVTKDAVVSALGYEPAEKEEFIEITFPPLTEAVQMCTFSEDAEGNTFELKEAYIHVLHPADTKTGQFAVSVYPYKWLSWTNDREIYTAVLHVKRLKSHVFWSAFSSSKYSFENNSAMPNEAIAGTSLRYILESDYIDKVSVFSSANLPAGTVVKIYGIRA